MAKLSAASRSICKYMRDQHGLKTDKKNKNKSNHKFQLLFTQCYINKRPHEVSQYLSS